MPRRGCEARRRAALVPWDPAAFHPILCRVSQARRGLQKTNQTAVFAMDLAAASSPLIDCTAGLRRSAGAAWGALP